jgi:hypothetical protein
MAYDGWDGESSLQIAPGVPVEMRFLVWTVVTEERMLLQAIYGHALSKVDPRGN